MIERERLALFIPFEHKFRKVFVLLHYNGLIFLRQCGGIVRSGNNRFHAEFRKTEIEHRFDVFEKIGVGVSECAPHIVIFAAASIDKLLELRNYLFPTAVARIIDTVSVVNFFSAVKA